MVNALDGEEPAVGESPNTVTNHDDISLNQEEPAAKRRKVRKGTRSCWECKRRKIRCIFASSDDEICLGCHRRRVSCVSQDLPEESSSARKGTRHLSKRIAKVEDLMKDFLASKDVDAMGYAGVEARRDSDSQSDTSPARSDDSIGPPTIQKSRTRIVGREDPAADTSLLTPESQGVSGQVEIGPPLHHLFAAFPTGKDAKILLEESYRTSLFYNLIITQPHSKLTYETFAAPFPRAKLPHNNTHPVIVAKWMLTFAITLQKPGRAKFIALSEPRKTIMHRLKTTASTWVTTREEMQGTVEGLICIMLEGVFETNSGNLRRAWAIYRRAMTVAQLMGLHRSPIPPLEYVDSELDVQPEIIWFRIVYMDRYLSLLLGLPQGSSDKSMGAKSVWQNEPPLGQFERRLTVIASRILERNERAFAHSELTETQSIDAELLRVSKSMPTSFWRPANFHGLKLGQPDAFLETIRLGAQVYYYGLLIQLHLPYMMRIGSNAAHEYSKMTCVNAARDLLTRFIAHRTFNPSSSCSRPIDFFTLLAAMTLLLAHLEGHYHRETTNFLAHQRLSDRAMLDQVLERMNVIVDVNGDVTSEKSATLVRRLLDIEADAAEGSQYTARSVKEDGNVQEGKEEGEELRLHIPYLGFITIARQDSISRASSQGYASSRSQQAYHEVEPCPRVTLPSANEELPSLSSTTPLNEQPQNHLDDMAQGSTFSENPRLTTVIDDWAFQGVDMAFFDSLMRGTSCLGAAGSEQQWGQESPGMGS